MRRAQVGHHLQGADGRRSADHDRLLSEMETQHQGANKMSRMLLKAWLDWKPMGFSPSIWNFRSTARRQREIAIVLAPLMLLGLTGDATYANYQEANRAFYRLDRCHW
jgi:phage portal protein BeeE